MSWFNISLHAKQSWDSHCSFKKIITGSLLGHIVVDKGLKKWPTYCKLRDSFALQTADYLTAQAADMNRVVANKLLEKIFHKEQIEKLGALLKNRALQISIKDLKNISWCGFSATSNLLFSNKIPPPPNENKSSTQITKELITYLYKNFSKQKILELAIMLKDRKLTEFAQSILTASLQPVCEKAVQSGLHSLVKTSVSFTTDFSIKLIASIFSQALFYKAMALAIQQAALMLNNTSILPAPDAFNINISTLLSISAIFHTSMVALFILRQKFYRCSLTSDKEKLQELAIHFTKESIRQKLKSNPLVIYLEIDDNAIDSLTEKILEETVNFTRSALAEKSILGLPLVY